MNASLKTSSLQSLVESDRASTDSFLAESLLDLDELNDIEYSIPATIELPSLQAVLNEFEADSDIVSDLDVGVGTPTPSLHEEYNNRLGAEDGNRSGSIMRYAMLQSISAQVASAADQINAGLCSACAVCEHYYAVGTSHGHILNFDCIQTLRWAHQDGNGQGAVSTMAYNADGSRLLAGFAHGLILTLDTRCGDVLLQVFDAVTPNSGILHVKWTSRSNLALAADSGGSVWSLTFTRKLGVRGCSARCLFSGARGEVCAIEPLINDNMNERHDLDQYCIVALATLSKYFVVTIRPRLKVIKYHFLQGPADCLPVMAWQMVLIQAADASRSVDPVLVAGRGNKLFFHQLFVSQGRLTFIMLRHIVLPGNLLSVHWLGPKCIGCIDTSEILHLMDVRSNKELESIDLVTAGVVYGSAQFKGLATGGNVSPALALAGTHACYNSLAARGVYLYILGTRSMHFIRIRTWMERITYLVKSQRWQEACDLALDGYKVAGERPRRKQQAKERILMLFKEYIAGSARLPESCLGVIIKCLITIHEMDLLWTQLWDRIQNHNKQQFLLHITEHIENESINRINPIISQELVDYWLSVSPTKLEDIILKIDWTCLDLNQVLKAAKNHKLYRAQIYLNANVLHDYTTSLIELIPLLLSDREHTDTDIATDLGNCLLVYISSCLAGRGYPTGIIPEELTSTVRHDVLSLLTLLHSTNNCRDMDELPYPYLRALLQFDTRETLNVISLAFQENEFNNDIGYLNRKRIIHILLEIMTPQNNTWAEIGCLLNFIAQQISQFSQLADDKALLRKVLNYLSKERIENESSRQHSERENAWHELLINDCLQSICSDEELLELAQTAHCHYVEEYLLEKLQRYDSILMCYLKNPLRHEEMFVYMERHAYNPKRKILEQLLKHIKTILQINAKEGVRIIILHFKEQLQQIFELIEDDESIHFAVLQNLQMRGETLNVHQGEKLLEFLCKYNKAEAVEEYLKQSNSYRIDIALALVQNSQLLNAAIYLAEKQGNYRLAFEYAMQHLNTASKEQIAEYTQTVSNLCIRSSTARHSRMSMEEREDLWFDLLKFTLPKEDLRSITKSLLQEAASHVDLGKLVQEVMNTRNLSGSFGDIKDLLMSMLIQSRQETHMMSLNARILENELSEKFHKKRRNCTTGVWLTTTQCAVCLERLYNLSAVLLLGSCGHALHEQCFQDYRQKIEHLHNEQQITDATDTISFQCPTCFTSITPAKEIEEPRRQLANPSHNILSDYSIQTSTNNDNNIRNDSHGLLLLRAPPRNFYR